MLPAHILKNEAAIMHTEETRNPVECDVFRGSPRILPNATEIVGKPENMVNEIAQMTITIPKEMKIRFSNSNFWILTLKEFMVYP